MTCACCRATPTEKEGNENKTVQPKAIGAFYKTRGGGGKKAPLGTSAFEKLLRNEDILARRNVIAGVGRLFFFFWVRKREEEEEDGSSAVPSSSELLPDLIPSA